MEAIDYIKKAADIEIDGGPREAYQLRALGYGAAISCGVSHHEESKLPLRAHKIACEMAMLALDIEDQSREPTNRNPGK